LPYTILDAQLLKKFPNKLNIFRNHFNPDLQILYLTGMTFRFLPDGKLFEDL